VLTRFRDFEQIQARYGREQPTVALISHELPNSARQACVASRNRVSTPLPRLWVAREMVCASVARRPLLRSPRRPFRSGCVGSLVRREMELQALSVSERSASHCRPSGDWKEKASDRNLNWFRKEIRLGQKRCAGHRNRRVPSRRWMSLTARFMLDDENLESRVRGDFNKDDMSGHSDAPREGGSRGCWAPVQLPSSVIRPDLRDQGGLWKVGRFAAAYSLGDR
jgi:hypothetical protein